MFWFNTHINYCFYLCNSQSFTHLYPSWPLNHTFNRTIKQTSFHDISDTLTEWFQALTSGRSLSHGFHKYIGWVLYYHSHMWIWVFNNPDHLTSCFQTGAYGGVSGQGFDQYIWWGLLYQVHSQILDLNCSWGFS